MDMHERSDLSRVQCETSQLECQREKAERLRMLGKLFSLYPPRPDAEMAMAAYLDELGDVPALLLSHGLKRLVRRGGDFVPSLAAIRKECARLLRARHRAAMGLEPEGNSSRTDPDEIDAERWLARARNPLPMLPAQTPEEPATAEMLERAGQMLEELARKMSAPR